MTVTLIFSNCVRKNNIVYKSIIIIKYLNLDVSGLVREILNMLTKAKEKKPIIKFTHSHDFSNKKIQIMK